MDSYGHFALVSFQFLGLVVLLQSVGEYGVLFSLHKTRLRNFLEHYRVGNDFVRRISENEGSDLIGLKSFDCDASVSVPGNIIHLEVTDIPLEVSV